MSHGYFAANRELSAAVREWAEDPIRASAQYGHISMWNVSRITDMSYLFCGLDSLRLASTPQDSPALGPADGDA